MPTREQTIDDAIRIFNSAEYPSELNATNAWSGVYQTLLWYESVKWLGFTDLPHIIDADKLRPASAAKKRRWTKPNAWQRRAQALSLYLAAQLRCAAGSVPSKTDLLMKLPDYDGMQRQNTLGIAFPGLVKHILETFGSAAVSYETEVKADHIFPSITFPGRSSTPRIDVLGRRNDIPRLIISAKWSVRHDRLNDITNECPVYKAAYDRIYRQVRDRLLYYVLTNEYDASRLNKMLADSCVDGVVHVHKAAVVEVCGLDGRLARLMDLADFISATRSW
ncbi:MAG: hypothetical protein HY766_00980 [candidate division NC10 bacterium]|nr:hypothetical protein [candidate division NC10 bacterium]